MASFHIYETIHYLMKSYKNHKILLLPIEQTINILVCPLKIESIRVLISLYSPNHYYIEEDLD